MSESASVLVEVVNGAPCSFPLAADGAAYTFRFQAAGGRLSAIEVEGETRQVLAVEPVIAAEEPFWFGGIDLNFDARLELVLIANHGAANAYAHYWFQSRSAGSFVPLGLHPVLRADGERRVLTSYERGGWGGNIFTECEYVFDQDRLTLSRKVEQTQAERPNWFSRAVSDGGDRSRSAVSRTLVRGRTPRRSRGAGKRD